MNCQIEQVVAQNLFSVQVAIQGKSQIREPSGLSNKTPDAEEITIEVVDDTDGCIVIKLQGNGERVCVAGNAQNQNNADMNVRNVCAVQVPATIRCLHMELTIIIIRMVCSGTALLAVSV